MTPASALVSARVRGALPWLAVLVLSIAFRLPPLINAQGTTSDAAVVGLQAMHLLRGEWSPFLWGSGYQTSVDSFVAAFFFLFTGPTPVALTASTLAGHIVLTWLSFDAVRRGLVMMGASPPSPSSRLRDSTAAAVVALPLVLTPDPVHTYVLYPPRQASLTLVFVAFWLLHTAASCSRARLQYAAGGAVALFAVYADPYALLFLPAQALLALLASLDGRPTRREAAMRVAACTAGALCGSVPYALLVHHPAATHGQTSLTLDVVRHNFDLLVDPCGPWLFSTKVYAAQGIGGFAPWRVAGAYHAFQIVAALLLVAGLLSAVPLAFAKRLPWELRRLGLAGALMLPTTISGFLVSPMVMDLFSSRYLAAILLVAPFCLAPAAASLGLRRFALALAPYLVSAGVSGWVSYRPFGLALHPSLAADDRLRAALGERGVAVAVADYWASYRLTLAWRESPIVVPTNEVEDRYRPYRERFEAEPIIAYVYDARRSRERLDEVERRISALETPFEPRYERFEIEPFTVMVLRRRPPAERMAAASLGRGYKPQP
jgi:hypothetical protein